MISTSWKRTIWSSALALGLLAPGTVRPDAAPEARAVVEQTSAEVLAVLADKGISNGQRIAKLTEIAEQRFDLKLMSGLILGRARRKLSPQQQDEFLQEFKRHLIVTYGDSLERYSNEKVEILHTRKEGNGDATVKTQIVGGNADGVLVDYRLRSKSGPWRVIDVIIENVSVVQNFRTQVQEIVTSHGPDQLISILREKNDRREGLSS
jgi:phospholipid transport system substrate-binding protein